MEDFTSRFLPSSSILACSCSKMAGFTTPKVPGNAISGLESSSTVVGVKVTVERKIYTTSQQTLIIGILHILIITTVIGRTRSRTSTNVKDFLPQALDRSKDDDEKRLWVRVYRW